MKSGKPKYYYDCPAEMWYMKKHYGLEYLIYPTDEQIEDLDSDDPWEWEESGFYLEEGTVGDALRLLTEETLGTGKCYVKPEFDHIFKPRYGDVDKYGGIYGASLTINFSRIFIRKGKHFFMPKIEVEDE